MQHAKNNKPMYITWSDISVRLPENVGYIQKLKKKFKKETSKKKEASNLKMLIENGKLLKYFKTLYYVHIIKKYLS